MKFGSLLNEIGKVMHAQLHVSSGKDAYFFRTDVHICPNFGVGERATNTLVRLHGCSSLCALNTKIS